MIMQLRVTNRARSVATVARVIEQYFTADQRERLAQRRNELGEDAVRTIERDFPRLVEALEAAMRAGVDPATPEVRAAAQQWADVMWLMAGGDERFAAEMQATVSVRTDVPGAPSPQLTDYLRRALS